MNIITSDKLPKSKGHYSHCIEHNGILYISGQLPIDPETGSKADGIESQTLLTLQNIELILTEAGSDKNKILHMRIYVSDISLWDAVNAIYRDFFGNHKPARCVVPVKDLHYGCLVEMEAIAHT